MQFSFSTLVSFAMVASLSGMVNGVYVKYCEHKDYAGKCIEIQPAVNACYNVPSDMNDKLTSYRVQNGNCAFYRDSNCNGHLWSAYNREHSQVTTNGHNDAVSSIRCDRSCCDANRYTLCNLACQVNCKPNGPITDQGCILGCTRRCCTEGVLCT